MTQRGELPNAGYLVVPLWVAKAAIGLMMTLVAGVFYSGWHLATIDSRVHSLEKQAATMERVAMERQIERDRLTIVEQQVAAMARTLDRIDRRLDRVLGQDPR